LNVTWCAARRTLRCALRTSHPPIRNHVCCAGWVSVALVRTLHAGMVSVACSHLSYGAWCGLRGAWLAHVPSFTWNPPGHVARCILHVASCIILFHARPSRATACWPLRTRRCPWPCAHPAPHPRSRAVQQNSTPRVPGYANESNANGHRMGNCSYSGSHGRLWGQTV
jgi:hypothetical protein